MQKGELLWQGTVHGDPKPLQRCRFYNNRVINPSAKDQQAFLADLGYNIPDEPLQGPLWLDTEFIFARPKSHLSKNADKFLLPNASWYHEKRPDTDNIIKNVLDSLNGQVFIDDCQFVSIHAIKRYARTRTEANAVVMSIYRAKDKYDTQQAYNDVDHGKVTVRQDDENDEEEVIILEKSTPESKRNTKIYKRKRE